MTLICVPIFVDEPSSALADAREARNRGADLVEFRVDSFFSGHRDEEGQREVDAIVRMVSDSPIPCIVTCRPVLEGGQYDGPDDLRISLFERLGTMAGQPGEHPPRYLDVELLTYTRSENLKQKVNLAIDHPGQVRDLSTSLILSTHDFHTRPPDLIRRIEQMLHEPACRVAKVAYRARSLRDNLELLDILQLAQEHGKPMIALGMGPYGLMSRVLAPKFNGFLTFASLRRQSATAPGQPIISELVDLYRFRAIGPSTRVYGVVGDPVEHSLSPHIHNAGFEAVGHDGVYLPFPIPAGFEHFKATVLAMLDHPSLDLAGLSVTIPHKENLVRLAREQREEGDERWSLDPLSELCGAANTLVIKRDPKGRVQRLEVRNTDGAAALEAIREAPGAAAANGSGGTFKLRHLGVLGAGGTARGVIAAAWLDGVRVSVANRTRDKAEAMLAELRERCPACPPSRVVSPEAFADPSDPVDAIINCTSVGMSSGSDAGRSPLDAAVLSALPAGTRVADCVYRPIRTPLLALAAGVGADAGAGTVRGSGGGGGRLVVVDGVGMFVRQAAAQFAWWTDRPAPRALFETTVREAVGSGE
jgi:3-dehydroquinate dehydratase/shikimate dehydrogenase